MMGRSKVQLVCMVAMALCRWRFLRWEVGAAGGQDRHSLDADNGRSKEVLLGVCALTVSLNRTGLAEFSMFSSVDEAYTLPVHLFEVWQRTRYMVQTDTSRWCGRTREAHTVPKANTSFQVLTRNW